MIPYTPGQRHRECQHEHGDHECHEAGQGHPQGHTRQSVRRAALSIDTADQRSDVQAHPAALTRSNIDKVEQEMEDIREQMELGNEISAAISNPVGMSQDVCALPHYPSLPARIMSYALTY